MVQQERTPRLKPRRSWFESNWVGAGVKKGGYKCGEHLVAMRTFFIVGGIQLSQRFPVCVYRVYMVSTVFVS